MNMMNRRVQMQKFDLNCAGCGRRDKSGFFTFPEDPCLRKLWLEKCDLDPSLPLARKARLCHKHFNKDDISFGKKRMDLKKHAVPSIHVEPHKNRKTCQYEMWCYACGKVSADSFHSVPKDRKIREAWLQNVGIIFYDFNPMPTSNIYLCSSHFSKNDFTSHPHSLKRRLRLGAQPLVKSQNGRNTQTGKSTKWPVKINNDKDFDPSDPDVTFVSSSSSNTRCSITLTDDVEEQSTSEVSKAKLQKSEPTSCSREKNISGKNASCITIDLTCEDGESSTAKSAVEKKTERIRQLKQKRKMLGKQLKANLHFLDNMLTKNVVRKKGINVIREFLKNLQNPVQ